MDTITLLVCLLPAVFIFHDFEEIIFFKPWITKNSELLRTRFPRLSKQMLPRFESLSTSGFALAVLEEFILLCAICFAALYFHFYLVWLAAFMAFSIHLLVHLGQWMVLRRYVPAIITSLISLVYSVYTFATLIKMELFGVSEIIVCSIIGVTAMALNVLLAHALGIRLDRFINNKYLKRD